MLAFLRPTSLSMTSSPARRQCSSIASLLLLLLVGWNRALGQDQLAPLSPSESYKTAFAPFAATRSQADDLTDADRIALGIGMERAAHDCLALSGDISRFSENGAELFALGQLCIFGQQFEPARVALVRYLGLPQPPQREQALILLIRAFIGLNAPDSAEPQIQSLLRDYPYDAPIHMAIDSVIDNAEASNVTPPFNNIALRLCQTQTAATLPILTRGKGLEGKDGSLSAASLIVDALRCAALGRASGQPDNLNQLAAVVQQSDWMGTAGLVVMQVALERQQMVGKPVPLSILRGHLLETNTPIRRAVSLARGTVLIVPFTLWSPNTPEVLEDLARLAPQQTIYAITSWEANNGRADEPSSQVLGGLRTWQRGLPRQVRMMIVSDTELKSLASDTFPAGILIRDGTVLMNSPLSGSGDQRLLLKLLTGQTGPHLATHRTPGH